ncbi:hypothetical protein [Agaribacter marinus]|uniref:Flagellar motor switch protein FliN-like C-terminal domain-containing protein n=1 Tax=Agaribacter marinus TaxID=1431249 RepID=A0AA37WGC4_9ALTE|nr:hypothetical protein [Agaribacter marinus]GLR70021.1 hypothetical protein GCM10007852_09290 [Agaribacter marinus]
MLNRVSIVGREHRAPVTQKLSAAIESWASRWFECPARVDIDFNEQLFNGVNIESTDQIFPGKSTTSSGYLVVKGGHFLFEEFIQSLSGKAFDMAFDADKSLLEKLSSEILFDLLKPLNVDIPIHSGEMPSKCLNSCVTIRIRIGDMSNALNLYCDNAFLRHLGLADNVKTDERKVCTSIGDALKPEKLNIEVGLDNLSLDIGSLAHLKQGQILKLSHKLEQPVNLTLSRRKVPVDGYLVRNNTKKAVLATIKEM